MIYPEPTGTELSEDQAVALDDTFLSSDPYAQASSRIAMMESWRDSALSKKREPEAAGPIAAQHGDDAAPESRPTGPTYASASPRDIATQLALDAFMLRQQLAENIARLTWAAIDPEGGAPRCMWLRVSDGPGTTHEVVARLDGALEGEQFLQRFASLVLPEHELPRLDAEHHVQQATAALAEWFVFATRLLRRQDLYLHGVYNKAKHGLAVAARDNLKLAITTVAPEPDDTIEVGKINGGTTDLITAPFVEGLHRAPGRKRDRPGLEITQVQVPIDEYLRECRMLAWLHGAIFHVVASRHFAGRLDADPELGPPSHPGLPIGYPAPRAATTGDPIGFRYPITCGEAQELEPRKLGFAWHGTFVPLTVNGPARTIRVVEDREVGPRGGVGS